MFFNSQPLYKLCFISLLYFLALLNYNPDYSKLAERQKFLKLFIDSSIFLRKNVRLMNTSFFTQAWNKHLLFIIAHACTTKIAINRNKNLLWKTYMLRFFLANYWMLKSNSKAQCKDQCRVLFLSFCYFSLLEIQNLYITGIKIN